LTCSIKIAQVGISEVVYFQGYGIDKDVRLERSNVAATLMASRRPLYWKKEESNFASFHL